MNIIIAGNGKVGVALTRQLTNEGHDITIIDSRSEVLESTIERYDTRAVIGNCASMAVLEEAHAREADLLIAVTSMDETNMLCCLTAHLINPSLHTIARIRSPEYYDQAYMMRNTFGLSLIVNPEQYAAQEIERLLKYPGFINRDTFAKGRVEIVELAVEEGSPLAKVKLPDLQKVIKCKVLVVAVRRDGKVLVPRADFEIQVGDKLFISAPIETLSIMMTSLNLITRRVRSAVLCGGGMLALYLADKLVKDKIAVSIIDNDLERCMELGRLLPKVNVIHGDASDRNVLESEGVAGKDALITMTGMDELNIIISLLGKSMGAIRTVTKIGHLDTTDITDSLPIGSVVSPKDLCTNIIVRYVRAMQNQVGAAVSVHEIVEGVEALEFRVDSRTQHCGEMLKNIRIRRNALLASITSGSHTSIPNATSTFKEGDTVVVISSGDSVIHNLNDIFV